MQQKKINITELYISLASFGPRTRQTFSIPTKYLYRTDCIIQNYNK